MNTSKAYHHGNLREDLVDAALAATDRDGAVPSLRAVATLAGVSHNAPYRHFDNHADLLGHVAARCFSGLSKAIKAATDAHDEPIGRARAGLTAYIRYGLQHPARYQLMFGDTSPLASHEAVKGAGAQAFESLVSAARGFGADDPYPIASRVFVMLHGAVDLLRSKFYPPGVGDDDDLLLEQIVDSALNMLRGRV